MKYHSIIDEITDRSKAIKLEATNAADELFLTSLTRLLVGKTPARLTIQFADEPCISYFDTLPDQPP